MLVIYNRADTPFALTPEAAKMYARLSGLDSKAEDIPRDCPHLVTVVRHFDNRGGANGATLAWAVIQDGFGWELCENEGAEGECVRVVQKVIVINRTDAPFTLSEDAAKMYALLNGAECKAEDIPRDCLHLVAVVQHFGRAAGGPGTTPGVVAVPDTTEWSILEGADGEEVVWGE